MSINIFKAAHLLELLAGAALAVVLEHLLDQAHAKNGEQDDGGIVRVRARHQVWQRETHGR